MLTNDNRMRCGPWLLAIAAMLAVPNGLALAGEANGDGQVPQSQLIPLTLTLDTPTTDVNRFAIATGLNTLVPGRNMENAAGVVDWSGHFNLNLYLTSNGNSVPTVLGVSLGAPNGGITQTDVALAYSNLPVGVQFTTKTVLNHVETASATMVGVQAGATPREFQIPAGEMYVMQMGGQAMVSIQQRPPEMQDLEAEPPPMSSGKPILPTLLELERLDGYELPTYQARLRMPMAGNRVYYAGTGLPVEWEYLSGDLVATSGMFVLDFDAVPEPTSAVLAGLMVCAAAWRLRSRRTIKTGD